MAIDAVICDIGDVLLLRRGASLEEQWEQRLGHPPGTFAARLQASQLVEHAYVGRLSEEETMRRLGALFGMNEEQLGAFN